MQLSQFVSSLDAPQPPPAFAPLLVALWWDAKGNWEKAHSVAQDVDTVDGAWVHAYLHRREGDAGNAGYWYRLARRAVPLGSLDRERDAIVAELFARTESSVQCKS